MESQGKDLGHAIDFLRALNRGLKLDELAKSVLNHALSQVPRAQGGSLIVLNKAEGAFEFRAAVGWDLARLSRIKIPMDRLLQRKLGRHTPTIIREPGKLTRELLPEEIAKQLEEFPVAVFISFPIVYEGEVIAYLNVDNRDNPDAFSQADIKRLALMEEEITLAVQLAEERERIQKSEAKFRNLVEIMPDAVVSIDERGIIRSWNKGAVLSFGYSPEEILGKKVTLLMPEEYKDRHERAFKSCLAEGRAPHRFIEGEGLRKDGTIFPVQWSISGFEQEGQQFFLAMGRDRTERVEKEEALRASENRYRAVFENMGTATVIIEEDTTISQVNAEFERLSGYSKQEIEGKKSWTEFVASADLEEMREYHRLRRIDPESAPKRYEFRFVDKNKDIKDVSLTVDMIPGTKKSVASLLDITAQKQTGKALQQRAERLAAINRVGMAVSSSLELTEILNVAVQQVTELFAVEHSGIMIFDEKREWGYVRAEYPDWGATAARFKVKGYLAAERIIADQKPLMIADVEKDPLMTKVQETMHRLGIKSMFIVPLVVNGGTIGSIGLDTKDRRVFNQEEIELAQAIASQLAPAIENARLHQVARKELAERKRIGEKLKGLHHAVDQLQRCANEKELWATTGRIIKEVLQFDEYDLAVREGDELISVQNGEKIPGVQRATRERGGIAWKTLQGGKSIFGNLRDFPEAMGAEGYGSFISVPIGDLGVLQAAARRENAFTQEDATLLEILANHLREEIARVRLEEELKRQAIRDPLTGLYNRRYLNEVLQGEVRRAQRYGHPFTMMILDLDEFKQVNDRYGHLKGDEVLQAVAELLQKTVRASDLVFRYGGDEFLLIFPETDGETKRVAGRLHRSLARLSKAQGLEGVNLDVSIGVAHWTPDSPLPMEELLRRADSVLYRTKRLKKPRR